MSEPDRGKRITIPKEKPVEIPATPLPRREPAEAPPVTTPQREPEKVPAVRASYLVAAWVAGLYPIYGGWVEVPA